jgi:hypothetical protein
MKMQYCYLEIVWSHMNDCTHLDIPSIAAGGQIRSDQDGYEAKPALFKAFF